MVRPDAERKNEHLLQLEPVRSRVIMSAATTKILRQHWYPQTSLCISTKPDHTYHDMFCRKFFTQHLTTTLRLNASASEAFYI